MAEHEFAVENADLLLKGFNLNAKRRNAGADEVWNAIVCAAANDGNQSLYASAAAKTDLFLRAHAHPRAAMAWQAWGLARS